VNLGALSIPFPSDDEPQMICQPEPNLNNDRTNSSEHLEKARQRQDAGAVSRRWRNRDRSDLALRSLFLVAPRLLRRRQRAPLLLPHIVFSEIVDPSKEKVIRGWHRYSGIAQARVTEFHGLQ
jgi:hypothetical protein